MSRAHSINLFLGTEARTLLHNTSTKYVYVTTIFTRMGPITWLQWAK